MEPTATPPRDEDIGHLQDALLTWFERNRRRFPWRRRRNPYAVLIAEKLLQQTAARDVVVNAYQVLLARYPTPRHLAAAEVAHLEEIIRPLGFIYRARELQVLGSELVTRHGGKVPSTLAELLALPGVGDYAARAVLTFALGQDVAVVDTNVARFLFRIYGLDGPMPANPARKKSLIALANSMVPAGRSKEWNWAVLDLCARICTPANPKCPQCPVRACCSLGLRRLKAAAELDKQTPL
jgi:A/G-specific adenine glycosylase